MSGTYGNKNSQKHGVHPFLTLGSLPKGATYIRRALGQFERALRETILNNKGEISLFNGAIIQTACRHEGRAQLLHRWLRHDDENLKVLERLAILKEIGNASDARDRALRVLELDRDTTQSLIDDYYDKPKGTALAPPEGSEEDEESDDGWGDDD